MPTHNPRPDYLARVLGALRQQTLPHSRWELVVVDNASREMLAGSLDIRWHSSARIVPEERLGLTFARLRGFDEALGQLIVMVDDDNVLEADYLQAALDIARAQPRLGAFGGRSIAEFQSNPPEWLESRVEALGVRDLGDAPRFSPEEEWAGGARGSGGQRGRCRLSEFPHCAPIGAGMVLRKEVAQAYAAWTSRTAASITDRRGESLASGGDNDICLTALEAGWSVGYDPRLRLTHLIPAERLTLDYHRRMARDSMKSFILMLDQHGLRPWPAMPAWTLPLRAAADWLRVGPWRGPAESIEWWGHLGMYEGRAALPAHGPQRPPALR